MVDQLREHFEAWWNAPWQPLTPRSGKDVAFEAWQAATSQARDSALDSAAKICDGVNNHDNPMTASDCADAIRALKDKK